MNIPVATEKKETAVQGDASRNKPAPKGLKPGDIIILAIGGWFFQQAAEKLLHGHFITAAIFAAIGLGIAKKPLKKLIRKFFQYKNI